MKKTQCFHVGDDAFAFSDESVFEFRDGKLFAELVACPRPYSAAHEAAMLYETHGMAKPGFHFDDFIFPTPTPRLTIRHPEDERSYVRTQGFQFGARFFGVFIFAGGWFEMKGVIRQSYEPDSKGVPVRLMKQLPEGQADPSHFHFSSIREASAAGVENVHHLLVANGEKIGDAYQFHRLKGLRADIADGAELRGIGKLQQLQELTLWSESPCELPEEFFVLPALSELSLRVRLRTLPRAIGRLQNLTKLWLAGNELESIPDEIAALTQLTRIRLEHNRLQTLPECLGNMPALKALDIENNPFTSLPESLAHIPKVTIEIKNKALYMDVSYRSKNANPIDEGLFPAVSDPELCAHLENRAAAVSLQPYLDAMKSEARWAVALETTEPDEEVGQTRFGGVPDLPKGVAHPETDGQLWTFLAQINLDSIAGLQTYLPRRGLLSFFCQDTFENSQEAIVLHFKEADHLVRWVDAPDVRLQEGGRYAAFGATATKCFSLPFLYSDEDRLSSSGKQLLELEAGDPMDRYEKLLRVDSPSPVHGRHVINHFVFTQHESPEELAAVSRGGWPNEWMVLLSLDYDQRTGFCFGDAGTLTFVIHKRDLAIGDFSNIFVSMED